MNKYIAFAAALLLSGCMHTTPHDESFEIKQVETARLSIAVWEKKDIQDNQPLRLYFEGDGAPNPQHAIGFDFAKRDPSSNVIYIARPCQWVQDKLCEKNPKIYQEMRFHPEIIKEMHELVVYLMRKHKAPSVELIGYDGGAVIALNMATAVPTDRVITIAGITDIDAYNAYHDLPPLEADDRANPMDDIAILAQIPQIHYVGKDDTITPKRLVERFVARMQNPKSAVVKVVSDTDHTSWRSVKLDY